MATRSHSEIRERFPALASGYVFMDNAGGSQVPIDVIEATTRYFHETYVQVGGAYPASIAATENIQLAREFLRQFFGDDVAQAQGEVILGSSTTVLMNLLADAIANQLPAGAEIIVAENGHEANVGPWVRLEDRGFKVTLWPIDSKTGHCRPETLASLVTENTAIVACPHVSNLLGSVEDIRTVTAIAHKVGAQVVVDGVAFAPHLPLQVLDWGVDWYVFSTYKVFGPHMAALWGRTSHLRALKGPNHFFIPQDGTAYAFEPGGPNHEGCAGIRGLERYLEWLAPGGKQAAMARVGEIEAPLTEQLLAFLNSKPNVRIIGPKDASSERLPTISFVHASLSNAQIVATAAEHGIGIKSGHFYSYRLCEGLGLSPEEGVARISLSHTTSQFELEKLFDVLGPILSA